MRVGFCEVDCPGLSFPSVLCAAWDGYNVEGVEPYQQVADNFDALLAEEWCSRRARHRCVLAMTGWERHRASASIKSCEDCGDCGGCGDCGEGTVGIVGRGLWGLLEGCGDERRGGTRECRDGIVII